MREQTQFQSGFPGPETQVALVAIQNLQAKNPVLAQRALKALAARYGLTTEALLEVLGGMDTFPVPVSLPRPAPSDPDAFAPTSPAPVVLAPAPALSPPLPRELPPTREELAQSPPLPAAVPQSPLAVADRLLARGEAESTLPSLSERAFQVYRMLLALGVAWLRRTLGGRQPPRSLSQLTVFVPNDALMAALGIPSASLYRALGELKEKGLITRGAWRTAATLRGKSGVYAAGTLYGVRLPHRARRPRLEREDFAHPWRDLEGDVGRGKTAWRALRESKENPLRRDAEVLEFLLSFALPPGEAKNPLAIDSLTALLQARPADRRRQVEELALGLAKEFKDPGSVKFYAWVLWNALRAEIYGMREGALALVEWAIARVREALAASLMGSRKEGIRRPGALLAHLLKEQGLLSLLRQVPQWRVA